MGLRMIYLPNELILSSDNAKLCLREGIFPITLIKKKIEEREKVWRVTRLSL